MNSKNSKERLFEVMGRLDKSFKPQINEWNFDKKKGEGKEEKDEEEDEKEEKKETSGKKKWNFEKKEDNESEKHEETETPEEEKEEHEAKPKSKIPVNTIAKVGGKLNEYDNYNYPAGADADPNAPWHQNDDDYEPENPSVKTVDFKLHGGIEDKGYYLYTVRENKPNSEFGNIISKVISPDYGFRNHLNGIYAADFDNERFVEIKQKLMPYMNVKSISEFVNGAEKIAGEMEEFEENLNSYNSRMDNYDDREAPDDRDRGDDYLYENSKSGKGTKKRLVEVMMRVNPDFNGKKLNEWFGNENGFDTARDTGSDDYANMNGEEISILIHDNPEMIDVLEPFLDKLDNERIRYILRDRPELQDKLKPYQKFSGINEAVTTPSQIEKMQVFGEFEKYVNRTNSRMNDQNRFTYVFDIPKTVFQNPTNPNEQILNNKSYLYFKNGFEALKEKGFPNIYTSPPEDKGQFYRLSVTI